VVSGAGLFLNSTNSAGDNNQVDGNPQHDYARCGARRPSAQRPWHLQRHHRHTTVIIAPDASARIQTGSNNQSANNGIAAPGGSGTWNYAAGATLTSDSRSPPERSSSLTVGDANTNLMTISGNISVQER